MKRTFLISTAAAALVAGTVLAAAQGAQRQGSGGAGGAQVARWNIAAAHRKARCNAARNIPRARNGAAARTAVAPRANDVVRRKAKDANPAPRDRVKANSRSRSAMKLQAASGPEARPEPAQDQRPGPRQTADPDDRASDQAKAAKAPRRARKARANAVKARANAAKAPSRNSGKSSVSFTTEQRTKIRETVLRGGNAPRVSKVDFDIKVGTAVPALRPRRDGSRRHRRGPPAMARISLFRLQRRDHHRRQGQPHRGDRRSVTIQRQSEMRKGGRAAALFVIAGRFRSDQARTS